MIIEGRARLLGDDVNTDYIISSRRKRETIDELKLLPFLLEGVDPGFAATVGPDDILVAGRNFGCGSAMEIAATIIRAAGIRAVVAKSFARSFYRNAINNGLAAVACDTSGFVEGERIRVALDDDRAAVEAIARGTHVSAAPLPRIMQEILGDGGLVRYLRRRGRFA